MEIGGMIEIYFYSPSDAIPLCWVSLVVDKIRDPVWSQIADLKWLNLSCGQWEAVETFKISG